MASTGIADHDDRGDAVQSAAHALAQGRHRRERASRKLECKTSEHQRAKWRAATRPCWELPKAWTTFTRTNTDIAKSKQLEIRNAVAEVQQIFQRTTFPEMKVNWQTHPNNLGPFYFSGCCRCHDGQHVSSDGRVLSRDCKQCPTVLSQSEGTTELMAAGSQQTFEHPVDLGDLTQVSCADCHTGGVGP